MRKYSFSQRVINEWNKLPNDCVNASSVNMFKGTRSPKNLFFFDFYLFFGHFLFLSY